MKQTKFNYSKLKVINIVFHEYNLVKIIQSSEVEKSKSYYDYEA